MNPSGTFLAVSLLLFCHFPASSGLAEKPKELNEIRFELEVILADLEQNEPLVDLNKKYRGYLEKQKAAYQKAGNLDGMLAVNEELKSFEDDPEEELSSFPELKWLQGIFREQKNKLEGVMNAKKLALLQSYEKRVEELSVKWTRQGKIEEAKLALEESERAAAMTKTIPKSPAGKVAAGEKPAVSPPPSRDNGSATPASATKEKPFVNGLGMQFVPVPIVGGPTDGQTVFFSVWETRVEDYKAFLRDVRDREWPSAGFPQGNDHPAVKVLWEGAVAFCEWLTEKERKKEKIAEDQRYRLPTDHEWSCAVGTGTEEDAGLLPSEKNRKLPDIYPWGEEWPPPKGAGNYYGDETKDNPVWDKKRKRVDGYNDGFDRTAPVGSFNPNQHGIYDLGGNVWEWCEELHSKGGKFRAIRGGGWAHGDPGNLLSSVRVPGMPGYRHFTGFRCVLAQ